MVCGMVSVLACLKPPTLTAHPCANCRYSVTASTLGTVVSPTPNCRITGATPRHFSGSERRGRGGGVPTLLLGALREAKDPTPSSGSLTRGRGKRNSPPLLGWRDDEESAPSGGRFVLQELRFKELRLKAPTPIIPLPRCLEGGVSVLSGFGHRPTSTGGSLGPDLIGFGRLLGLPTLFGWGCC